MNNLQFDWTRLTEEERQKLGRIQRMLESRKPFEAETQDIGEQIAFIRRHATGQNRYYTNQYLMNNPRRTKSIYYTVREEYVRKYRIDKKKDERATASLQKMLMKALVTPVTVNS